MAFRSFQYYLSSWFLAWRVAADCSVYGIDYSNGGSYNIDASSDDYFTFTSVFEGCEQETINPILVAPSGDQYPCSAVTTTPEGEEVTSSCGIAYSSMPSGQWKIIISGTKMAVQRVITLTAGTPETVVITATPTVVIGLTSTPAATTVFSTIGTQTQTLILVPKTITAPCDGPTQTLTITPKAPTVTRTSTIVRTKTDKQTTIHSSTTVTETATCHYPTSGPDSPGPRPTSCIGIGHLCMPSADYLVDKDGSLEAIALVETQVKNNVQAVAASTVTVTETTYTVTTTSLTTLPTPTAIENG
ncbi:hypothetical protein F5Y15DRAFT_756 [Xylariaceae sp. FL0016]|nr:hypothetical protein F5Y15DRAFT_756 [Xylariaceae sp. FL0016]